MKHTLNGVFQTVLLSPLDEADLEVLRVLRNKKAAWFLNSAEILPEQQRAWYQKYLADPRDVMFRIALAEKPDCFIGAVALYDVDTERKQAEFGRLMIDREAAGRGGLGYDATMCACRLGFEQLGLQRIYLDVYADNLPAVKTYERVGFQTYAEKSIDGRRLLYMEILNETPYK